MGHGIHFLSNFQQIFWTLMVSGGLALFALMALSKKSLAVPEGLQNIAEAIVEALLNMFEPELGKELMPLLLPFFGTFFLFVLVSNVLLLVPFPFVASPTGDLSATLALAIVSLVSIQFLAMKLKGPGRYFGDWINPHPELTAREEGGDEEVEKCGFFKSLMNKLSGLLYISFMKVIIGLLILLHVVDNGARLLSLSFRLFGNIFGEHFVYTMVSDVATKNLYLVIPLFIPFLVLVLDILISLIQAVVFCMLSLFYLKEEAAIHT